MNRELAFEFGRHCGKAVGGPGPVLPIYRYFTGIYHFFEFLGRWYGTTKSGIGILRPTPLGLFTYHGGGEGMERLDGGSCLYSSAKRTHAFRAGIAAPHDLQLATGL